MTQQDIDLIRAAILSDVPPPQRPVANALLNFALEVVSKAERITVAFEKIAASHEPQ